MEFILWISGVITTLSVVVCIYFYNRRNGDYNYREENEKLKSENDSLKSDVSRLNSLINSHFSLKRKANFVWDNWYYNEDPNTKWSVTFELTELMQSEDGSKVKFDVSSIHSGNSKDVKKDIDFYKSEFFRSTGGGWVDVSNKNLTWITNISKAEERSLKLRSILGDGFDTK